MNDLEVSYLTVRYINGGWLRTRMPLASRKI